RTTTLELGASTDPRLCTVTFTRRPSTFTSSFPIPRSGRDQYGTPLATSLSSITVVTCGGNVTSTSRLRSNVSVRVLTSLNGASLEAPCTPCVIDHLPGSTSHPVIFAFTGTESRL